MDTHRGPALRLSHGSPSCVDVLTVEPGHTSLTPSSPQTFWNQEQHHQGCVVQAGLGLQNVGTPHPDLTQEPPDLDIWVLMQFEAVCAHLGSLGLRVARTPCFSLLGLVLPGVMGEPLFWQHATSLASGVVFGGVGSSLLPQVNVHVLQAGAVGSGLSQPLTETSCAVL